MFDLTRHRAGAAGHPQVEVSFDHRRQRHRERVRQGLGTGKQQSVQITGGSALNKDDIDKMVRDAEEYAEEDRRRREEARSATRPDTLVYSTEKFLRRERREGAADVKGRGEGRARLKEGHRGNDL